MENNIGSPPRVCCGLLPFCLSKIVTTKYGDVEGDTLTLVDDFHNGIEIDTYLGIPFARPPVGELRFTNPVEPDPWEGVYAANDNTVRCVQSGNPIAGDSEDCLYLNVFTPSDPSGGPYAVMVWLYGGGFNSGSNVGYVGHFLAAQGVVVVIPNYRVNIFGFAYSMDDAAPGNMGLRDMTQALHFIQDNIANFSGDPSRVTIFGESAGGSAAGDLIISPEAEGLFHQAGCMSGVELSLWSYFGQAYDSLYHLQQVAAKFDCPLDDTHDMVDCLRQVDAFDLYSSHTFNCSLVDHFCVNFRPVVDGPGGFMPESPWVMREKGKFQHVTEFIGICDHDGFYVMYDQEPMSREEFLDDVYDFGGVYSGVYTDPDRHEDVSAAMAWNYSPWPHIEDPELNRLGYGYILTDAWYGTVADQQAKYHQPTAPVYYYVFDYVSDEHLWVPDWIGTTHGMELYYVFGDPFKSLNPAVLEDFPEGPNFNDEDREFSYHMMILLANFAKFGDPSPEPVQAPDFMNQEPMVWETFEPENMSYYYFGQDSLSNRQYLRQHQYAFWQQYIYYLAYGDEGRPEDF